MSQLILTIDDSLVVRKIMVASLQRAGFQAASFGDGRQALQALSSGSMPVPAAIFVDINLPGLDGYAVTRAIRHIGDLGHPVIIMLTGRDGVVDKMRGRLAGASAYLTKPFKTADVLLVLRQQLALASHAAGPGAEQVEEDNLMSAPVVSGGRWTQHALEHAASDVRGRAPGGLVPGWAPPGNTGAEQQQAAVAGRARVAGQQAPTPARRKAENSMQKWWQRSRGQGLVEYALMIALVAIVVIAILVLMGPQIGAIFSTITHGL